jgi:hypothetical protein
LPASEGRAQQRDLRLGLQGLLLEVEAEALAVGVHGKPRGKPEVVLASCRPRMLAWRKRATVPRLLNHPETRFSPRAGLAFGSLGKGHA